VYDIPPSISYIKDFFGGLFCYNFSMVITVLDAEVDEPNWQILKNAYANETANMPDDIYQTFLIQSQSQPSSWRIMTQWRSQEDLNHMRKAEAIPPAVRVFQAANAKPALSVWDIRTHRINKDSGYFIK